MQRLNLRHLPSVLIYLFVVAVWLWNAAQFSLTFWTFPCLAVALLATWQLTHAICDLFGVYQ